VHIVAATLYAVTLYFAILAYAILTDIDPYWLAVLGPLVISALICVLLAVAELVRGVMWACRTFRDVVWPAGR
jgi:hypothetical protein